MASDAAAADPEQPGEQTSLLARTAPRSSGAGAGGPAAASAAGGAGTSSQEQRFTDGGQAKAVRRWRCSVSPKALLGLVLVALVVVCLHYFSAERLHTLFTSLQGDPLTSAVLFFIFNALGVVFMLPGMVLSIGAGAVFGFWRGAVLSWVATSVGTTLAFVLGRYLLADTVEAYVKDKWVSGRPSRRGRRGPAGGGCVGGCATPQLVCVPHPPRPAAPPTPPPAPAPPPPQVPQLSHRGDGTGQGGVEAGAAAQGGAHVALERAELRHVRHAAQPGGLRAALRGGGHSLRAALQLHGQVGRRRQQGGAARRGGAGNPGWVGWCGAVRRLAWLWRQPTDWGLPWAQQPPRCALDTAGGHFEWRPSPVAEHEGLTHAPRLPAWPPCSVSNDLMSAVKGGHSMHVSMTWIVLAPLLLVFSAGGVIILTRRIMNNSMNQHALIATELEVGAALRGAVRACPPCSSGACVLLAPRWWSAVPLHVQPPLWGWGEVAGSPAPGGLQQPAVPSPARPPVPHAAARLCGQRHCHLLPGRHRRGVRGGVR